jgi:hypothetical protein
MSFFVGDPRHPWIVGSRSSRSKRLPAHARAARSAERSEGSFVELRVAKADG